MNRLARAFIPGLLLVAASSGVHAHHGWSEYDSTRPLSLAGVIEVAGYDHPHGHIRLKTREKSWSVVLAPPSRMQARGLQQAALAKGVAVTVLGYANRSKPDELRAERITVGGRTIELR